MGIYLPAFNPVRKTSPSFYVSTVQFFKKKKKHCEKRHCTKRTISPIPTAFSTVLENFSPFSSNLNFSFANTFSLGEPKIYRLGEA